MIAHMHACTRKEQHIGNMKYTRRDKERSRVRMVDRQVVTISHVSTILMYPA